MKNRHLPATLVLLALVGAARCGGGTSPTAPTAPTTPNAPSTPVAQQMVSADLPAPPGPSTPGLYQDGLGTYPPGDDVYLSPGGRDLFVRPVCTGSAPRALNLVLSPAAREVVVGRLARCTVPGSSTNEWLYLHLPNPLMQQTGAVIGANGAPPNTDISVSVNVALTVDSNGDGVIKAPPDDLYQIRWQKGIYLKQRSETATTTAYELTTLETSFGPDLSCSAELLKTSTPQGEISKGFHCLPLVLTVTLHK